MSPIPPLTTPLSPALSVHTCDLPDAPSPMPSPCPPEKQASAYADIYPGRLFFKDHAADQGMIIAAPKHLLYIVRLTEDCGRVYNATVTTVKSPASFAGPFVDLVTAAILGRPTESAFEITATNFVEIPPAFPDPECEGRGGGGVAINKPAQVAPRGGCDSSTSITSPARKRLCDMLQHKAPGGVGAGGSLPAGGRSDKVSPTPNKGVNNKEGKAKTKQYYYGDHSNDDVGRDNDGPYRGGSESEADDAPYYPERDGGAYDKPHYDDPMRDMLNDLPLYQDGYVDLLTLLRPIDGNATGHLTNDDFSYLGECAGKC